MSRLASKTSETHKWPRVSCANDHVFLTSRSFVTRRSCVGALSSLKLKKKRDCLQSKWVGTWSGEDTNIIRVHVDTYRKEYFDRISFLKQSSKIDAVYGVRPLINYSWSSVEIPCWFTSTGTYKVIWKKNLLAFYHKSDKALFQGTPPFYLMHFIPLKKHSLMLHITCTIILWTHSSAD